MPPPVVRSRGRRAARAALWTFGAAVVLVIALAAGLAMFASSGTGLAYLLAKVTQLTDGKLTVTGARGSLLSRLQLAELRWNGATAKIVARNVVLEWQPAALARRELHVDALGAQSIELSIAPSDDAPAQLPRSLGLPFDVVIVHASVTTLDWKLGERAGRVTGIAFGYRGGAREHAVSDVTLAFDRGRVSGDATLAAAAPFALGGHLAFAGSDDLRDVSAKATIDGVLARIGITADGHARDARFTARAQLTPFAAAMLDTLDLDASNVDVAAFDPGWPRSSLALRLHARPAADGFAGDLALSNDDAGPIDAGRIPLRSLSASFAQRAKTIELRNLDARIGGRGRVSGSMTVALATHAATAALALDAIDLHAIQGALVASRVSGNLRVSGNADVQTLDGSLTDSARALSLAFAARVADSRVTLSRAHLAAAAGTLDGHGEASFAGKRPFAFDLIASRFDPSRLGAFPAGALQGRVKLRGELSPAWSLRADATLAPGARIGTQPASGSAHATLAPGVARDVALDVHVGGAHVTAHGNAGKSGDALAFSLDVPHVADVAALLPQGSLALRQGALHAAGTLSIAPASVSAHLDGNATRLLFADGSRVATLSLNADVGGGGDARHPLPFAQRTLAIDARATGIADATRALASASVAVHGTLASHQLRVALAGAGDHLAATAHGALQAGDGLPLAWHGVLDTLGIEGTLTATLRAPAAIDIAAHNVHVGAASLSVAGGNIAIGDLLVDHGRIASRGGFDGVPLDAIARLAGHPLPVASTLTLQGEWALAANPRIEGTFGVRNQRGDVFASDALSPAAPDFALGIRKLAIDARIHEDAWTVDASLDSLRAGSAALHATLAPGATAGVPSLDAPINARLTATLASLAPLQPWLGTSAVVSGRADVDLQATGTLRTPVLSGRLSGDALRVDAPQWGLSLADGRLRASLAQNVVKLDEFSFAGGDGRFTASGTLARADANGEGAHVSWHAEHFRLLNRPDLTLVITGDGVVTTTAHKLALSGKIGVDRGSIVYVPSTVLLGDDVVIKGAPKREAPDKDKRIPALALDLEVDLGRAMTFSGEGLDAQLGGHVHVTTSGDGTLNGQGTISAQRGTYYAFGQQLTIDRGRLIFNGPLDNPALDIVALRKNLAVEAGVEVTGTVRIPRIQLTSNPPVSDGEKLSWLITGQPPGTGSAADTAALAAASSYLLGGSGRPIGARIAQQIGLDDISLRSADSGPSSGSTPASGQVVSIGKRLSNRLTLVYEQGLTVASNALRLEYALSRTLTLRVEAGTISGFGIFYRRSYD
ncbi:MAG: translocation/assembly module TamB domain-containing protein [Casimicrobiaceae bacterium]